MPGTGRARKLQDSPGNAKQNLEEFPGRWIFGKRKGFGSFLKGERDLAIFQKFTTAGIIFGKAAQKAMSVIAADEIEISLTFHSASSVAGFAHGRKHRGGANLRFQRSHGADSGKKGEIATVGGMDDIKTGVVTFLNCAKGRLNSFPPVLSHESTRSGVNGPMLSPFGPQRP